jgi:D-alanine-D-alanine ligase
MKTKKIAVLYGGHSREKEVSIRSGLNVCEALVRKGYDAVCVDPVDSLDFTGYDIVYNALHGTFGEDGSVQSILKKQGIPYTGSGVMASVLTINKLTSKHVMRKEGIPTAPFDYFTSVLHQLPEEFCYPVVVKPNLEGSSVGVFIVDTDEELITRSEELIGYYNAFLLESFIKGKEITVSVLEQESLTAFPILELRPQNRFYDYEAKYTAGKTEFILPATLSEAMTKECQALAIQVYRLFQCSGAARIDMIVDPEKGPFVLELNTSPGMTSTSDLPAQAAYAGLPFDDLVEQILLGASIEKHCD